MHSVSSPLTLSYGPCFLFGVPRFVGSLYPGLCIFALLSRADTDKRALIDKIARSKEMKRNFVFFALSNQDPCRMQSLFSSLVRSGITNFKTVSDLARPRDWKKAFPLFLHAKFRTRAAKKERAGLHPRKQVARVRNWYIILRHRS